MTQALKIAVSGGPGVGKTSIIKQLKAWQFDVRHEVFTELFNAAGNKQKLDQLFSDSQKLLHE